MRFNPLRSRRRNRVTMINSVSHLIAGVSYNLPAEEADLLILKGYAAGELSRPWSAEERAVIESQAARDQVVVMDWDQAKLVLPANDPRVVK